MSVRQSLLLLCSAAAAAAAAGEARVVRLGILHRLSAVNVVWDDFVAERSTSALGPYWEGVSCAAELALRHAQQQNGSVVRELGFINKSTTFEGYAFDTESDAFGGITGYRQAKVSSHDNLRA